MVGLPYGADGGLPFGAAFPIGAAGGGLPCAVGGLPFGAALPIGAAGGGLGGLPFFGFTGGGCSSRQPNVHVSLLMVISSVLILRLRSMTVRSKFRTTK